MSICILQTSSDGLYLLTESNLTMSDVHVGTLGCLWYQVWSALARAVTHTVGVVGVVASRPKLAACS
jgi:hypothetical protein